MTSSAIVSTRAEALFVSPLQPSENPTPRQVGRAVAESILRYRRPGCAALVAQEYGDHPAAAIERMRWAVAAVRAAYPPPFVPSRADRPARTNRQPPGRAIPAYASCRPGSAI